MKTLEYPLVATSFTEDQVKDIMSPLLKVTLNLCGIQKRLPYPLLYGPLLERGCGLKDIFILQLAFHLMVILKHQQRDTTTSDLLQEAMENVQFYVGSDQNFWDIPFEHYELLVPEGWMKFTWKCLSNTKVTMRGPLLAVEAKRRNDVHLMDAFIQSDKFTEDQITILQKCRLFLHATTLSDICTADGSYIDLDTWEERRSPTRTPPPIPTITPSKNDWIVWRSALRSLFLHPISTSRALLTPLGPWKSPFPPGWNWFRDMSNDRLYQKQDDTWIVRQRTSSTTPTARYFQPTLSPPPPPDAQCQPVSVRIHASHITVVTSGAVETHPARRPPRTLQQAIEREPITANWAVKSLHVSDNGSYVAEAIKNHTALAVSDGSLKMDLGTSAFIIVGETNDHCIRAVNMVPGPIQEGDSHRCELAGAYGTLLLLEKICELHSITNGRIRIACDNQRVVDALHPGFSPHPNHANFDLVSAVRYRLQLLPIEVLPEHVKGHQDDKKDHTFTRAETLNIAMDKLAKAYWVHLVTSHEGIVPLPQVFPIEGEGWQLFSGDQKLTRPNTYALYNVLYGPKTRYWWRRKHRVPSHYKPLSEEHINLIDWPTVHKVFPKLQHNLRMWATKHSSHNCGLGTTLQEWKFQEHSKCPRCSHTTEDNVHVFTCQLQGAHESFQKSLNRLNAHLKRTFTHRLLRRGMIKALMAWHTGHDPTTVSTSSAVTRALIAQSKIGWENLLVGLPATEWLSFQQEHYSNQRSRRNASKWLRQLLPHLIRMGKRQWLHRNKYKHQIGKPDEIELRRILNKAILHQFQMGKRALLPGDKAKLDRNPIQLLHKPLHIRKAWWHNIHAARQRYERKKAHDDALLLLSRQSSVLLKWIRENQSPT